MAWYTRLKNLFRSQRLGSQLDRELDFHLAERADELVARGWTRPEAEREARIRFGHRQGLKERTREVDVLVWLESIVADVRYALRGLKSSPGFALTVILSIGLGIGANTAIFSLVNAALLKSLPVEEPEQLVQLTMGEDGGPVFTNPIWEEIDRRQESFDGVLAFSFNQFNLATGGEVRPVEGNWVSGDFFRALGVLPVTGRLLGRSDDYRGCPATAVLGYGFWQSEFGGEPATVGRLISLNGHPFEVIGVAAPAFFGVEVGRSVQVYAPLCAEAVTQGGNSVLDGRSTWWLSLLGRPRDGMSPTVAAARLAAIAPAVFSATLPENYPVEERSNYLNTTLAVQPAVTGLSNVRNQYQRALITLMVVVGIVLLIACANVANLLLARGTVRQREIAMRLAIGAGRGRLVRQLFTESLLLSLLGALVGVLFARWSSGLLVGFLSTRNNLVWLDLTLDGRVLGFTMAVAVATSLLFGLVPAWRATRVDPQVALKANARGLVEGHSRLTLGKALVISQVALSLVLVMGAGLLLGTLRKLSNLDPGFRRDGVLVVRMDLRSAGYSDARRLATQREILTGLRALPGIRSAASAAITPISGMRWNGNAAAEDQPMATISRETMVLFNRVSDAYFTTMGTPLLAGRDFGVGDTPGSPKAVIVNQALAHKYFGTTSPVGRTLRIESGPGGETRLTVIGMVGDAKYRSLREELWPTAFLPESQSEDPGFSVSYMLLTDGPPVALAPTVRSELARVDPRASFATSSLSAELDRSLARERLLATLSGFFGALALLLALVGLYGTMAYSVARRRNEIGIRIALGAAQSGVLRLVLGEVGRLVVLGVALGVLAAVATTRLLSSFLYGLTASDPSTMLLTTGAVVVVAFAAGGLPAWRAARLDPVAALREE